jgi:signal transduction histidine kinase
MSSTAVAGKAGDHTVQFYERDEALIDRVADFLAAGLDAGQPLIAILTAQHRAALTDRLAELGYGDDEIHGGRRLLLLDAREVLDALMVDGMPDERRFTIGVADVMARFMAEHVAAHIAGDMAGHFGEHEGAPARVFGELVDLLWMDGNPDAAIRLERLWNELAGRLDFALLCAYSMDRFADVSHAGRFMDVCREHGHVLPTERYTRASDAERSLQVSMLQQRARALETELERRAELDARLRTAVAAHDDLLREERAARAEAERARTAALEASRAKSAFLAMMSHELRTPLNAIGGYSELIGMGVYGPVAAAQRDALTRVQHSQQHLLGLIDQLLDYAQLDSGTLDYTLSDVPLQDVLRAADALMAPRMRERRLAYATALPDQSIVVRADRGRLLQIMRSLLANAVEFTEPGGRVEVECEPDGAMVLVHVRDTGTGIPPSRHEQIFDAFVQGFVQGESSFTRVRGGVGLGLAISRHLARGMGGELRLQSEVGTGSVFTLVLPRVPAPDVPRAVTGTPASHTA